MKLSKTKQLEFLDNDVSILEIMFANQEGTWLTLPGEYMPDGEPFKVSLEGVKEMTGELRQQLVQTVKDQYDARETSQTAPPTREATTRQGDHNGGDSPAPDRARGSNPADPRVQSPQETIFETIKAREGALRKELERCAEYLAAAQKDFDECLKEVRYVEVCINALHGASPKESETTGRGIASTPPRSGSKNGSVSSPKRTTNKSKKS